MKTLSLAILSICLSVAAQFTLKVGVSTEGVRLALSQPQSISALRAVLTNNHIMVGFLLYGLGAAAWLGVLAQWDVSKAYPLAGLGFVLTGAIGFITGEQVTLQRAAGMVMIGAGVYVVSRS